MESCGHELKHQCFYLYEALRNLNHGSFGTVPRDVVEAQREFHIKQESCPELWFREWYMHDINAGRFELAKLINSENDDVVFVENASFAVNSVIASFSFQPQDVVICFDCAYKMVKEALEVVKNRIAIKIVYIPISYPVESEQQIIESFESELAKHGGAESGGVKLCIFDHVSSMPAIVMPVEKLTALAKAAGATVLIDGAHAPGMVDIDVQRLGADLYTGNCHKWLFAPKGTAFLWTRRQVQTVAFPLPCVVSSTGKKDYVGRFEYTGTRDYTPFLCLPAALRFIDARLGGIPTMRAYNETLLRQASDLVRVRWQSFYVVPMAMTGYMSNVALPRVQSMEQVRELERRLFLQHISIKCEAVQRCTTSAGVPETEAVTGAGGGKTIFFVRLSAQVYLQLSDFEEMADAVLKLLPDIVM